MSLASVFSAGVSTALSSAPTAFTGPNGYAEVTTDGNLRVVSNLGQIITLPAAGATAFANWVNSTFG